LLITREMGVSDAHESGGRWSLDHLFIDQDAVPTLVEVKRSSDTRIRREVIGQILDYAANAVSYWSIEEIQLRFERACEISGKNPESTLNDFLQESFYADKFWDTVQTNLKAGKIRLLLIADAIPKEMQRVIEFLNGQMSPCEILGVEIKQFIGRDLKTLVPRVIGATINAKNQKDIRKTGGSQWSEERFFEEIKLRDPTNYALYESIYAKSLELFDDLDWGFGNRTGSFKPYMTIKGIFIQLFIVYSYGAIEIQFQHIKSKKPFNDEALRSELLLKLNNAVGINLGTIDKRPAIKIERLKTTSVMDAFFEVVKWYINTIRNYYSKNENF